MAYNNSMKRNADTQEEAWVADEDRFVLKQAVSFTLSPALEDFE
jgi:hypothetical protein